MPMAICLAVLLALAAAFRAPEPVELVVCGWDEVYILRFADGTSGKPQRVWTWRAKERADLPDDFKKLFNHTDECKPFDGGARILITSSDGAVALVDRERDRVVFYGRAPNAHSADLLPGGRVAVAASHHATLKGDRLILFDVTKPDRELASTELSWGHGVVWDAKRRQVWALADKYLFRYFVVDVERQKPQFVLAGPAIPLPDGGGHDLSVVDETLLAVSTNTGCWLFDRATENFRRHPELGDTARVKGISHHPGTGRIAYVQAEGKNWWAERIHLLNPPATLHVPGEHFYKVRWILPTPRP